MKKIILTGLFLITMSYIYSQKKNEYIIAYGKYFLSGIKDKNHYLFWQYSHITKVRNLYLSLRCAFYLEEYLYNQPIPGMMNYIVAPDVIFPMDGIIKHDPTTTGIKQLEYIDGKFSSFRVSAMVKYKFIYFKRLYTSVYAGAGIEYTYDYGLMDGDVFEFKDPRFQQGRGVVFFGNYNRGLDFYMTNVLQTGIVVSKKLDVGLDIKMDYYFSGGLSLFTNSIYINYKF